METELQRLTREIRQMMARVYEILHEQRPDSVTDTLVTVQYNEGTTFGVSWQGRDWSKGEKSLLLHYQGNSEPSFEDAAVKALKRGNQACIK